MKTFTLAPDGTLTVVDTVTGVDKLPGTVSTTIAPWQIAQVRRDPAFESALQAAAGTAGNITAQQLATLPAPAA